MKNPGARIMALVINVCTSGFLKIGLQNITPYKWYLRKMLGKAKQSLWSQIDVCHHQEIVNFLVYLSF